MQWRNAPDRYGHFSVFLHWLTALTLYGMFALGLWMVTLGYYDNWYHKAPEIHKSIGILLMMGLAVRLIWRIVSPPPPALKSYSRLTHISAVTVHILLYILLIAILLSGYLISTAEGKPIQVFGWFEVPATAIKLGSGADLAGEVHLWLAWTVVIISILHALAALKHHFIDKDATLKRMLGKASINHGE